MKFRVIDGGKGDPDSTSRKPRRRKHAWDSFEFKTRLFPVRVKDGQIVCVESEEQHTVIGALVKLIDTSTAEDELAAIKMVTEELERLREKGEDPSLQVIRLRNAFFKNDSTDYAIYKPGK